MFYFRFFSSINYYKILTFFFSSACAHVCVLELYGKNCEEGPEFPMKKLIGLCVLYFGFPEAIFVNVCAHFRHGELQDKSVRHWWKVISGFLGATYLSRNLFLSFILWYHFTLVQATVTTKRVLLWEVLHSIIPTSNTNYFTLSLKILSWCSQTIVIKKKKNPQVQKQTATTSLSLSFSLSPLLSSLAKVYGKLRKGTGPFDRV